jgi:uncharacterized protein YrzB (UPF0473 family)
MSKQKKGSEENSTFTVIDPNGKSIQCEILFTFDSEDFNKSYIVYTDHSTDEYGVERVYASIYDPSGADLSLQEIKTKAEWEMIDHLLNEEN